MQSNKKEDSYLFKYNVGYTTGTFDLFHVGHLNLLERAKQQCEYLVVGVSTDALVAEYKGRAPIIPFEDRIRIIAALKCVDGVIPQESMDKIIVWNDWKNTPLYNETERQLQEKGVDCIYFPYTKSISSRDIRERIERKS